VAAAALALVTLAGCSGGSGDSGETKASRPTSPAPLSSPSAGTSTAVLRWVDCGSTTGQTKVAQQCARLAVPRDWAHPTAGAITLSLRRVHATDSGARIGSLLINPGGPGESAVTQFSDLVDIVSKDLRKRFDVVAFDPRGVGDSTPVRCVDDATIEQLTSEDPVPTDPPASSAVIAGDRTLAAACARTSGDLLPYLGTRDVARDMDAIRAAVGDRKLSYLGFSYGTALGAMYADLFPKRVRALVLDGPVDPAQDPITGAAVQANGFQSALAAFLGYCGQHRKSCPYPAGAAGERDLNALLDHIRARPLPTSEGRTLEIGEAYTGVAAALYDRASGWPVLADALTLAERGDGTILLRLNDLYTQRDSNGHYSNLLPSNTATTCDDHRFPKDLSVYERAADQADRTAPDFGEANVWSLAVCALWPVTANDPLRAPTAVQTAPSLIIGATGDPATPYVQAKALNRELDRSVLLTRKGEGHTSYGVSDCIQNHADEYLIELKLPAAGTTCTS
jgi:pimeloyl-ACP methyl ester carboxylesterase